MGEAQSKQSDGDHDSRQWTSGDQTAAGRWSSSIEAVGRAVADATQSVHACCSDKFALRSHEGEAVRDYLSHHTDGLDDVTDFQFRTALGDIERDARHDELVATAFALSPDDVYAPMTDPNHWHLGPMNMTCFNQQGLMDLDGDGSVTFDEVSGAILMTNPSSIGIRRRAAPVLGPVDEHQAVEELYKALNHATHEDIHNLPEPFQDLAYGITEEDKQELASPTRRRFRETFKALEVKPGFLKRGAINTQPDVYERRRLAAAQRRNSHLSGMNSEGSGSDRDGANTGSTRPSSSPDTENIGEALWNGTGEENIFTQGMWSSRFRSRFYL